MCACVCVPVQMLKCVSWTYLLGRRESLKLVSVGFGNIYLSAYLLILKSFMPTLGKFLLSSLISFPKAKVEEGSEQKQQKMI